MLYLLPNLLTEEPGGESLFPRALLDLVPQLQGLIAESAKSGRHYLRHFLPKEKVPTFPLELLNEHSSPQDVQELLHKLSLGGNWGLISDAGLPCIADPGSDLVFLARQKGMEIKTLPGPSSLFMALQLSGLPGQHFAFHGYLPRDAGERREKILELELRSGKEGVTQLWIEAPYRCRIMLDTLIATLRPSTLLAVAVELTSSRERVLSQEVELWRKTSFRLEKEAAVFLMCARRKVDSTFREVQKDNMTEEKLRAKNRFK